METMTKTKTAPIGLGYKILDETDEAGTFEAYVAVIGNVDLHGERIKRGAFDRTLKAWQDSGTLMPFILYHNTYKLEIGGVLEMSVDDFGLKVKVKLLIAESADALNLWGSMKLGVRQEFSIGYLEFDTEITTESGEQIIDLLDLELFEASKVFRGANTETTLISVKSNVATGPTSEPATVKRSALAMRTAELERS